MIDRNSSGPEKGMAENSLNPRVFHGRPGGGKEHRRKKKGARKRREGKKRMLMQHGYVYKRRYTEL